MLHYFWNFWFKLCDQWLRCLVLFSLLFLYLVLIATVADKDTLQTYMHLDGKEVSGAVLAKSWYHVSIPLMMQRFLLTFGQKSCMFPGVNQFFLNTYWEGVVFYIFNKWVQTPLKPSIWKIFFLMWNLLPSFLNVHMWEFLL